MPAIYIHWPFCVSKCPYCDFNSRVGDTRNQEPWRQAYRLELEHYARQSDDLSVSSVFFGGGTPSLMDPETVDSVLSDIARLWRLDDNTEITLEANPSSSEAEKFAAFRKAGVNRLSLGVQSFDDDTLKFFGRAHNAAEARHAVALAAEIFPRYSFDLIYGFAGHTTDKWITELDAALPLARDHLSAYQLTIEPHTAFYVRAARGEALVVAPDDECEMYEMTQQRLASKGLPAYEISNYARKGMECRHNMTYWRYEDYVGIGPGAHGRLGIGKKTGCIKATENLRAPEAWLRQVFEKGQGLERVEELNQATAMQEALLMGLRLTEGIDLARWNAKFSTPLLSILDAKKLDRLAQEGLVRRDEKTLALTSLGRPRLNAILKYISLSASAP